jgi:anti-sigma B factor antagonist
MVQVDDTGAACVISITGRLGDAGARSEEVRAAFARGGARPALIVDVSGVDYVSSPGLQVLEEAAAAARHDGRTFVLCGASDAVRIALDLAGLSAAITTTATRDGAMALAATARPPASRG